MATPGRPPRVRLTLTVAERATLTAWTRKTVWPHVLVRRARIVLLLADGLPIAQVARMAGVARRHVYRWAYRWAAEGLDGLLDKPKGPRGRKKQ